MRRHVIQVELNRARTQRVFKIKHLKNEASYEKVSFYIFDVYLHEKSHPFRLCREPFSILRYDVLKYLTIRFRETRILIYVQKGEEF